MRPLDCLRAHSCFLYAVSRQVECGRIADKRREFFVWKAVAYVAITSRDNPLVREIKRLLTDARARRKSGRFVTEGARLCADAARSGVSVTAVLYTARAAQLYAPSLDELRRVCGTVQEIPDELARYIADTASPQGVFCLCETPDNRLADGTLRPDGQYLALEDVQDPSNLGTVIRTAEAMELDGLLLSAGCCDVYNPKVVRGSMGGVFRLPVHTVEDMCAAVEVWQQQGFRCWACVVDKTATPLPQATFGKGVICLIGNEGNGLRPETVAVCRNRLTIPMPGRAESLNASMAAGIVLWEMGKTR